MNKRSNSISLRVLILFVSFIFAESEAYSQCSTPTPAAPSSLTLATTSTIALAPPTTPTGTVSGLVGYWKFDERTGSTACDSSGQGNTGTLTNGPLWAIGKVGGALYFDGVDDHITVADSNSLDVSSSFTLSAWVNPASTSTDFRSILVKNYKYYLYASAAGYCGTGNPLAGFDEQSTNAACQPTPLPANTWTHLAASYTGSILTFYRNGIAVATSNISKTLSPTTGTLQIGASQFGENFKGLIDEVRVHNRSLTTTEVQALFQQESAVRESGLFAHWKFDEGTGTTASDSSGSGNAGILTNGPVWTDGRIGKGLFFDGVDDNVRVADSNSLDVSSSFTLSAWVNPASSFTDFRSILVKNYKYYLYGSVAGYCGSGSPLAGFDEQTSNNVCQSSPLAANTWTHLAATYTGSILTLYRNGAAVATSNIARSLSPSTGTLQIGASQFGENFKGLIDEVRVHNRALTNSEIQATFQQESGGIFNFSLLSSGDKSVVAGSSVTNSIAAALVSGTTQSISFSTTGMPSGTTATFSSASCTLACSTVLTINTTGSTPAGSFPITVTSTGGGVTRTTAFTLSVTLALTVAAPTTTPDSGTVAAGAASSTQNTSGNTYYVATNGNDSNSGTISNPFRSIAKGINVLRGGDTLYIRGGTYLERMRWPVGGTSAAPTIISNYQSEIVTIRPSGEGAMIGAVTTANQWTVFNGLIIDGVNADQNSVGFGICCGVDSRITFQNGEVKNFPGGGLDLFAHNNRVINTKIHHNAVATSYGPPHGMYITGYGNLLERLEVYSNGYYGIHIYNSGDNSVSDNIVRYSSIHNNGLQCTGYGCGGYGIIVSSGSNNQVYSNLIYSNGGGGFGGGIQVNYRCVSCKIYSNTVYNNYGYGIDIDPSSTGVVVRNNISTNNRSAAINNQASGTIISNNMTSDPRFVNPSGNDFRLQSGSGAIDIGFNLSTIGITTDLSGVNRPQGSGFDIGAYEYVP